MIVVDTNVLVYFYVPTDVTQQAARLREIHPHWIAPRLWRSELRSALSLYMRKGMLTFEQALRLQTRAENLLADCEFDVPSQDVLQLVNESPCSAYDCEFVALAKRFNTKLVTSDKKVINAFPDIAVSLVEAGA
jgi:predicted nucleic acid-binding protein